MLQWRLWNEMRSQHQPVFCGPAQWSPSQTGLGNLATRGSERGFRFPALWGREGWDDASDLQLQWWKYRSFHHRDPFQGWVKSPLTVSLTRHLLPEVKDNHVLFYYGLSSGLSEGFTGSLLWWYLLLLLCLKRTYMDKHQSLRNNPSKGVGRNEGS